MALNKQALPINFAQGLDLKTDPLQVQPGKFLSLQNSVFTKGGLLQKRNGYGELSSLPDNTSTFLTTFNGNLTAIGTNLEAYSAGNETWVDKGPIQPVELSVLPVIRSNTNQSQADTAIASNGLICTVYTDNVPVTGSIVPTYKYVVTDSTTGQNIVAPTLITSPGATIPYAARVFLLGNFFVIVFTALISGTYHLQYIAVSVVAPSTVTTATDISTQYAPQSTVNFDGVVVNTNLYIAWNGNDAGGAVRMTYLTPSLSQANTIFYSGHSATLVSVTADITPTPGPNIYVNFYASPNGYTFAVDHLLNPILAPTLSVTQANIINLTSVAQNGSCIMYYEVQNFYGYDGSIQTDYILLNQILVNGDVVGSVLLARSVGLASKAFLVNAGTTGNTYSSFSAFPAPTQVTPNTLAMANDTGILWVSNGSVWLADQLPYILAIYVSPFQPTYFLLKGSTNPALSGQVVAKLAYSNGPDSYYLTGLPSVKVNGLEAQMAYLFKDLISSVNKNLNAPNAAGVYSQTGVNVVDFVLTTSDIVTAEIGNDLMISGGFLWQYDGYSPVENNFHLWPDYVEATASPTGGTMSAQQYFYQVTYEWADNQGNVYRSAPSIPVSVTTTGSTSSVTLNVPTLRLTYKLANPVKICIYRWSAGQEIFYQTTSILLPQLNIPTLDSITYVDTLNDTQIIGNNILYTTGGVLEDIGGPASNIIALFNNRLFMVDAEDPNLLWFSKEVIEATPVEMSDLLTIYVAPTTSAQGSTGPTLAMAPLDDKLILFKENAIYYINGVGPDITGSNSQYSDAIFVTSTVGCTNQHSIVFQPQGLMFQSDKGIWLLDRSLNTSYIGAPVEGLTTGAIVLSANNIPGTNQVRFTLDTGVTLMYDYYYGQWGTFVNVPSISSTLYDDLHTYIDSFGRVFQETPGAYIDGSSPVLMQFTTSWLNMAGLQGFERAYFFYLLGTYLSPHRLQLSVAYDYNTSPSQSVIITPDNGTGNWGGEPLWGAGGSWGGPGNIEQWRMFFTQGKCQAFQITLQELAIVAPGISPGAGFTMSGILPIFGTKSSYPRLRASRQVS